MVAFILVCLVLLLVEEFLKPHLEKPFMLAKKKEEKFGTGVR